MLPSISFFGRNKLVFAVTLRILNYQFDQFLAYEFSNAGQAAMLVCIPQCDNVVSWCDEVCLYCKMHGRPNGVRVGSNYLFTQKSMCFDKHCVAV